MILIVVLYAFFASTFSISKTILNATSPCLLVGMRMCIASILLLGFQAIRDKSLLHVRKEDIFTQVQVSIFSIFICYCLEFWGMSYMPSFKTCALFSLGPFITYIIACIFFSEPLRIKKWLGLSIGFIGLLPILFTSSKAEDFLGTLFAISWPEVSVMLGVVSYSYGWFVIKKMVQRRYSPVTINGYGMFFGGLLSLGAAAIFEQPWTVSTPQTLAILLPISILVGNLICYNLYAYLLHQYSTTLLSFASVLAPLFAAFYGWVFLNEQITWHFFASMAVIMVGLLVFYHDEFSQKA